MVLTDLLLPDISGEELVRQLLKQLSDPKPPIIAVTAYSTPERIAQARLAGIVGFVTKPASLDRLSSAINAVISPPDSKESTNAPLSFPSSSGSKLPPNFLGQAALVELRSENLGTPTLVYLRSVAAGDQDRFHRLVELMRVQILKEAEALFKATALPAFAEVSEIAHRLSPIVAGLGYPPLGAAVAECKKAAEEKNADDLENAVNAVRCEVTRAVSHLSVVLLSKTA